MEIFFAPFSYKKKGYFEAHSSLSYSFNLEVLRRNFFRSIFIQKKKNYFEAHSSLSYSFDLEFLQRNFFLSRMWFPLSYSVSSDVSRVNLRKYRNCKSTSQRYRWFDNAAAAVSTSTRKTGKKTGLVNFVVCFCPEIIRPPRDGGNVEFFSRRDMAILKASSPFENFIELVSHSSSPSRREVLMPSWFQRWLKDWRPIRWSHLPDVTSTPFRRQFPCWIRVKGWPSSIDQRVDVQGVR